MDLSTYKIIHYVGIMTLFFAFGGLTLGALTAGGRQFAHRKIYSALNGAGLLLLLVSGFGQIARTGLIGTWPTWLITKIVIWLALGLSISIIYRMPKANRYIWAALLILGGVAAYLGHIKPV